MVVAGRREEPLREIAAAIGADWVACDITDEAGLNAAVASAADKMGGLDIGVNSTGWGQASDTFKREVWQRIQQRLKRAFPQGLT